MRAALACMFFLSGSAALLFESLWFRQTLLAFGSSVWASSLVLSGFMAGLALGNAAAARFGHRVRHPIHAYAVLEIAIALLGVGLVVLLPRFGALLAPVFGRLLEVDAVVQPLRFLVAFLLLVGPAAAMGATLPLLVRALSRGRDDFGSTLGFLYGWNTLGAVSGALIGELFLIERLGVLRSAGVAAALNLAAALGALLLVVLVSGRLRAAPGEVEAPAHRERLSGRGLRLLGSAFLSGALLLALQVIWFRLLVLFVAGTSQAFAVMLAIVLAGIAGGGLLAGAWLRRRPDADRFASVVALLAGAVGVLGYGQLGLGMAGDEFTRVVILSRSGLALALVLMLPTSIASGVFFTLAGKRLNDGLLAPVRSAGLLTLVNTIGSAIGPVVAGFLLLPVFGVEISLFALCASYALVALGTVAGSLRESRRGTAIHVAAALAFALALVAFPFGRMNERYLGSVVANGLLPGAEVVAQREGLTETIQLARLSVFGQPVAYQLMTDGYPMSNSLTRARRYMNLFVHLPVALHPGPKSALLISYGVGNTARALTRIEGIESIDVVDISRDILSMAEIMYPRPEENPLRDPKLRVHVEDGRYFLQTTDLEFDLITGEPPPPNLGHVAYLYTQEYFQLAHDRLRPGGLVSYWVPMHQIQINEAASIAGAFCAVFADCSLWNGGSLNWVLLGSRGGLAPVTPEALSRQWSDPETAADLRSIGVETPGSLGGLFVADAAQLRDLTRIAPPVRDDYPLRIHNWASPSEVRPALSFQNGETARGRFASSAWIRRVWPESLRRDAMRHFRNTEWFERVTGHVRDDDVEKRFRMIRVALEESELEVLPLILLGSDPSVVEAARAFDGPTSSARELVLARDALSRRRFEPAADHYEAALGLGLRDSSALPLAVYARCRAGDEAGVDRLREVLYRDMPAPEHTAARVLSLTEPGIDGCWAAAWDADWRPGL